MRVEPSELKEKISRMSDEELLRMVGARAHQYRQEALDYAWSEIARRGLAFDPQENSLRCPKCAGDMVEGFIPDFGHNEYVRSLRWVEGKPERSFWKGAKVGDRRQADVSAYRCTACGYVEFYALAETPDEGDV
jgi:predicted nucleic-acid-binding Zn-ribbon protein